MWYAVNGSGQGVVFVDMPERDAHNKVWAGNIFGLYCRLVMELESEGLLSLPVLKWSDEPVKLELNINVC